MLVELDHKGMITLVNGTSPSYQCMNSPLVKKCGVFKGSYGVWSWYPSELDKLSDDELFALYQFCK